jgi:hypothetical protein
VSSAPLQIVVTRFQQSAFINIIILSVLSYFWLACSRYTLLLICFRLESIIYLVNVKHFSLTPHLISRDFAHYFSILRRSLDCCYSQILRVYLFAKRYWIYGKQVRFLLFSFHQVFFVAVAVVGCWLLVVVVDDVLYFFMNCILFLVSI